MLLLEKAREEGSSWRVANGLGINITKQMCQSLVTNVYGSNPDQIDIIMELTSMLQSPAFKHADGLWTQWYAKVAGHS